MKVLLASTGASGQVYALELLRLLCNAVAIERIERPLFFVRSYTAIKVARVERLTSAFKGLEFERSYNSQLFGLAVNDFTAPVASGSYPLDSMIVAPCSTGTLGRIAAGLCDSLITRAAHVQLKERRRLVLVVRETPLGLIDTRNMLTVTEAGGIIMPASPGLYLGEQTLDEVVKNFCRRVCNVAGVKVEGQYWTGVNKEEVKGDVG